MFLFFPFSNELPLFTSQVLNSTNNSEDPPNAGGLLDNNFTTGQFDLKGIVPDGIDDLDTEPYFDFDEHYVGPSCTSPDSLYLPYLEDSIDKVMSDSSEDADINHTPLNLSSNGRRRVVNQSITVKGPLNLTIGDFGITVRKDYPSIENVMTLSNKWKLEDEKTNYIPPTKVPNSLHEVGNQIPAEDNTSQQVSATQMHCIECIQAMHCTECIQVSSFHGSQLGVDNQTVLEDNSYQNPLVQEKNKHVSFDSGISIQASPTLTVHDSLEEDNTEAALLEVDECSVLDLSITTGSNTEVRESTCNYCDETNVAANVTSGKSEDTEMLNVVSEMECDASSQDTSSPTQRIGESDKSTKSTVANNIGNDEDLEAFKSKHVVLPTDIACDLILNDDVNVPDSNENKSETNVAENVTYEKSEDIEMPNIVSEMECDVSSHDSSPTVICENAPCNYQSITNKSTCSDFASTVENEELLKMSTKSKVVLPTDIACDPILNDDVSVPNLPANSHENKSDANVAVNVTSGKSEDIEMPNVVSEMECVSSSQDTSSPIIICESVPTDCQSKPNKSAYSNAEFIISNDIGNSEHLETPFNIACDPIHNDDNLNQALDSSLGFEAVTVDIGTIDDSKTPHILHGSDSGVSLQNSSDATCQPVSYENHNVLSLSDNNKNTYEENAVVIAKELKSSEYLNVLHNDEPKTDTQNTDHLIFSSEHINIQQEAIGSKSDYGNNTVDIGTFENSSCLDTSNILHGHKKDNIQNTSSPTNVKNQPLQIVCKNNQDNVVSSIDMKDSNFVYLCEEATKSFNGIDSDLSSSSSGGSFYENVKINDLIDLDPDCDWSPSEKNLEKMFKSVCNN